MDGMQAANVAEAIARDIAALAAAAASAADCQDDDLRCDGWAVRGECGMNPGFMHRTCRAACGLCRPEAGNQTAPGEGGGKAAEQPKQAQEQPKQAQEQPDLQQMQQSEPQRALPLLAAADSESLQQRPASGAEPDQALRRPYDGAGEQAGAQQGAESRAGGDPEPGTGARSAGGGAAGGQLASAALSGVGGTGKEAAAVDAQAEGAEARPASQDSVQAVGIDGGATPAEEGNAREAYAAASGDARAGPLREPSLASAGGSSEGRDSQQAAGEQQSLAGAALVTDRAKPHASAGGEGAVANLGATPSAPANAAADASAGKSPADLRAAAARESQARGVAGGDPDAQPDALQERDRREGASAGQGAQGLQDPGAVPDPDPDPEDDPDPMEQSDEELRAAEARAAREEWVARLRESAAASAAAKAAKAGASTVEDARSAASGVTGSEGGGGGGGGQQGGVAAFGGGARAEADDAGDTSGRGGGGADRSSGDGGGALQRTDLAQSFQAVQDGAGGGGAGSSVRAPDVKVQGAAGEQGARQAEERAGDGAALTQTPAQALSSPKAQRRVQAGSQKAEWARLRAAAASGDDGSVGEHLSPDKRASLARRGSDGTARDARGDRSADRSGEAGSGNQGMLRESAATQKPAAGGGGGDGGYLIAVGRDGLNTLAPLKGAAGAAVALAQAAARLEERLQRACHANPALSMAQVTDCLAEAKRAGADVLRNPLRAPALAASRAPVLEQRSGDAPVLRALAARAAVQDSGRVGWAHSSRRLRQRGAEFEGFVGERPPQPPAGAWGTGLLARLLFSWTGRGVLALGAVVAFLLLLPRGGRRRRHRSRID